MNKKDFSALRSPFFALLLCFSLVTCAVTHAQEPATPPTPSPESAEDVVRISTELVQTDVMVFDKQGRFVDGLKPEQFELKIDGKPQPLSFFERITAGTFNEEAQLAAARGRSRSDMAGETIKPLDRGRSFILFIDDLHIRPGNLPRTREALSNFIEREVGQNDEVAIFTASGQLGFLEQMTQDKAVMQLAVKRLNSRFFDTSDGERTPMNEFQALAIERNDRAILDYYVDQLLKETMMMPPQPRTRGAGALRGRANSGGGGAQANAEVSVKARAKTIVQQATAVTRNTLGSLNNVVRLAAPLPGRKLLFFISDGFFFDPQMSTTTETIERIADSAARSGTVIYTQDSRGLSTGLPDTSQKLGLDLNNQTGAASTNAHTASQEPLYTLAAETGGRALLDSNNLVTSFANAKAETSVYYLLAWRPSQEQRAVKFHRLEVSVKDRPDLLVRVRRGFLDEPPPPPDAKKKKPGKNDKKKEIEDELYAAIKALYPKRALPVSLSAGYLDTQSNEAMLTASVEVDGKDLGFGNDKGEAFAALDVVGAVVDNDGKSVNEFEQNLIVTPQAQQARRRVVYNHQLQLKPGLYQVRVAARDRKSGRTGSAMHWIDVPDLKKTGFSLSSVFVGEVGDAATQSGQLSICADRRFTRASRLGFLLYVYNASRSVSAPDVALQVQIFRDDQPVITRPLFKLETGGQPDLSRLSYGEEISLASLPAGRYVLQITAIDRAAKATASQRVNFIIE